MSERFHASNRHKALVRAGESVTKTMGASLFTANALLVRAVMVSSGDVDPRT